MKHINMFSRADMTKGHGVLSAHDEQVALVKKIMGTECKLLKINGSPAISLIIIPSTQSIL